MPGLIGLAVVGGIVLFLLVIFRKDIVGVDLSARSLVRLYLYLASLAAVVVFAIGIATTLDWAMAATLGPAGVYGQPPTELSCKGAECPDPETVRGQMLHEREQRQARDLVRGITFTAFGAILWGAHFLGRRAAAGPGERASALRRAYMALGTFVFGLTAVALIPLGVFLALSFALVPASPDVFREGYGETLSIGIVALPVWLYYLLRLVRDFRAPAA